MIWRDYGIQPWRAESFRFSTDPHLEAKVVEGVGLYSTRPPAASSAVISTMASSDADRPGALVITAGVRRRAGVVGGPRPYDLLRHGSWPGVPGLGSLGWGVGSIAPRIVACRTGRGRPPTTSDHDASYPEGTAVRLTEPMDTSLPAGTSALAVGFAASGIVHLVRPQVFEPLVPRALPAPRALVYASGVAELVCALGLVRRARWAPRASAVLLLAVWPGNAQHAVNMQRSPRSSLPARLAVWGRLPLQLPMIRAALRSPAASARSPHWSPRA